ncbi:MAG: outer membrane protein assembly factor BamA [Phycisphaerae bacterium]|nr:outer membrane protein assembly factor BamA [Phycisphaerae bacterium]
MPRTHLTARRAGSIPARGSWSLVLVGALMSLVLGSRAALAQGSIEDETFADRPVARIEIVGLDRVSEQEIRNNIRIGAGQPYDPKTVRDDVATLYRLGHFEMVNASATLQPDGTVVVTYRLTEQALVRDIQTVGNKAATDQELRNAIPLVPGGPRDDFLMEQSVFRIKELYKNRGHYLVEVTVDESRLKESGVVIFRILEGPRVRIRDIEFVGNAAFPAKQLQAQIKTKAWFFLFVKGNIDEQQLIDDVAALDKFYRDRGFVDVRIDRRAELSPDQKEAKLIFVISEGRQYRLRAARIEGPGGRGTLRVFDESQLQSLMVIRPGDVFQQNLVKRTLQSIETAYRVQGYIDVRVQEAYYRVGEAPEVDLLLMIDEGDSYDAGLIRIQGNFLTRDKVIRRLVRIQPGRPLDGRELSDFVEARLVGSRLFNDARVTAQEPDPDDPRTRDVLVEVKERNTGSLNFGVSLGSDTSFAGEVSLSQYNFDIADTPLSFGEFISGRGFRGAGQSFNITAAPGIDVSTYSIGFAEPHLFESDYGGSLNAFYRDREFSLGQYSEQRYGVNLGISRQVGDFWRAGVGARLEHVELDDFSPFTPIEVFNDRGPAYLSAASFSLSRNTVDNPIRPSRGSVIDFSASYYGAFGGDYSYPFMRGGYTTFLTLDEDFLGRKSVLRLNTQMGYIFSSAAPTYERFYLGGRSFRGFEFRSISPKSSGYIIAPDVPNNNPVGGQFLFFAGAQYEVPLLSEMITGVVFTDTGTVQNTFGFDQYRVSAGVGVRLYIEALGPAPLAFDLAWPIVSQEGDIEQVFSFTAELPF